MKKRIVIFAVLSLMATVPSYTMNSSQEGIPKPTLGQTAPTDVSSANVDSGADDESDTTDFTDGSDSDSDTDWLLPPRACEYGSSLGAGGGCEDLVLPRQHNVCVFPTVGDDSDDEKDTNCCDTSTGGAQFNSLDVAGCTPIGSSDLLFQANVQLGIGRSRADLPGPPHVADRGVLITEALNYRRELQNSLALANERLSSCRGIVDVSGTTAVVGDLHGDFGTFKRIINFFAPLLDMNQINNVVFLGDIMDRGNSSAKTLLALLQFFNKYPGRVYIVRGNHETRDMFESHNSNACPARDDPYFNYVPRELLYKFFDNLPYAAIINGTTLAVHGGVPQKEHWKNFQSREKYSEGSIGFDLFIREALWSDYNNSLDFDAAGSRISFSSSRGGDTLCFNESAAKEFLASMKLKYMVRGHQPDLGAFHQSPNKVITTVFSSLENQGFDLNVFGAKTALVFKDREPQEFATFFMF